MDLLKSIFKGDKVIWIILSPLNMHLFWGL